MAARVAAFDSDRPILPPLHTLNLPRGKPRLPGINELYDSYEPQTPSRPSISSDWLHPRQASISSSTSSRTPSPSPSDMSSASSPPPPSRHSFAPKMRLVPTTLEEADAVVLVAPPTAPYIPTLQPPSSQISSPVEKVPHGQALLLVGAALQHIRHPNRQIAKGARIHPYRIVRGDRRTSAVSASSTVA